MAGHVANPATKFEDPTTIHSWVTSYNSSHWLPLKMCMWPLSMCRFTWPVIRGSKTVTFFGISDPDFPIHYTSYWAPTMIKGCLLSSRPMLKPHSGEKKSVPSKWGSKMTVLGENGDLNHIGFTTPKRHFLAWNWVAFCIKIGARVSAVAFLKNPPPKKIAESLCRGVRNHACAETKPLNRCG